MRANVLFSYWSVLLAADLEKGVTIEILQRFYKAALELEFKAGSVGLVPLPNKKKPEATPFVVVMHCDTEDAQRILARAGIESFTFEEVKTEDGESSPHTCEAKALLHSH